MIGTARAGTGFLVFLLHLCRLLANHFRLLGLHPLLFFQLIDLRLQALNLTLVGLLDLLNLIFELLNLGLGIGPAGGERQQSGRRRAASQDAP